jgi:selenide,water dikinase
VKNLLLVGAGHAHAALLAALAKAPLFGARITLVSPNAAPLYSGMLPGVIAGHYRADEARMDIARLAGRACADFVQGTVEALDPATRTARLKDGREVRYDIASLNLGSLTDQSIPGSAEHAIGVKPFEVFIQRVESFTQRLSGSKARDVAVVGAGAAGVELAMAIRHRGAGVSLYSDRTAFPAGLARRLAGALRHSGVDFRQGMAVHAIDPGPVVLAGASRQAFDLVVLATAAAPIEWPRRSSLATDERGFILVDASLRSVSHPEVFAAGDCATVREAPHPKSGVYSVRHGAVLLANLRKLLNGEVLEAYRPQKRVLLLIGTSARSAIAARGNWTAEGRWVWWWKDWIDRRWIKRLAAN